MKGVIIEKSFIHGKNEIKCIRLNTVIAKYTDEIRNPTFNFGTSFQWNRNGETGTQLPKLLSFHLRTSLWFYQTSHSGTFCFTPGWMKKRVPDNFGTSFQWNRNGETGTQLPKLLSFHLRTSLWFYQTSHSGTFCFTPVWMKKRVPDHLRFVFWNEMIKLRRQFVQNDDTRKKIVSKLSTAIKLYVNVNWETTFLPLWREELNKLFFFVNVNAYSNISVSKPASFDTVSTKISQFCSFAKHC